MTIVDEVSPSYYGEDRIDLQLSVQTPSPQSFDAVIVDVDYARTLPQGVVLPLEMTIMSPSGAAQYQRVVFSRLAPSQLSFVPREGGSHLLRFAEQHHNRWFGSLVIDVAGTQLNEA